MSRIVPQGEVLEAAQAMAARAASFSAPAIAKAKECVNAAFELPLREGLCLERREFWACFALEDAIEGIKAFIDKRPPVFADK